MLSGLDILEIKVAHLDFDSRVGFFGLLFLISRADGWVLSVESNAPLVPTTPKSCTSNVSK